jgi:hypothetical protein
MIPTPLPLPMTVMPMPLDHRDYRVMRNDMSNFL